MVLKDLTSEAVSESELREKIINTSDLGVQSCFRCLRCTSGCTSMKILELRPHFVMAMVRLGLIEELISSGVIWSCALCLKCEERCPQETSPRALIMVLRNLAVQREQNIPEGYLRVVSLVLDSGLIQQPMEVVSRDFEEFTRDSLGLPRITGPGEAFKENLISIMSRGSG